MSQISLNKWGEPLRYRFELTSYVPGTATVESVATQDRVEPSFAEFLAERAEAGADLRTIRIDRTDLETGVVKTADNVWELIQIREHAREILKAKVSQLEDAIQALK